MEAPLLVAECRRANDVFSDLRHACAEPRFPCFTRRSENGKSFPKTGNFFPRRTNGIPIAEENALGTAEAGAG
jgi:hypothetical protein